MFWLKHSKQGWSRKLETEKKVPISLTHLSSIHICWPSLVCSARFQDVPHKVSIFAPLLSLLTIISLRSVCEAGKGALMAGGKTDATLVVDGIEFKLQARQRLLHTNVLLWLGICHSHILTMTETISHFLAEVPPVAYCAAATSFIQKFI